MLLFAAALIYETAPSDLSPLEIKAGYRSIFDGTSLEGWKGWRKDTIPKNWSLSNGTLMCSLGPDHGDIRSPEMYGDFDLILEWKIERAGNSGIFYRATEDSTYVWRVAPEFQVLDDEWAEDRKSPLTSAGSCYGLYPRTAAMGRPAGQWNEARIIAKGNHVEHWLNGVRVVSYDIGSPDWENRMRNSKFAKFPEFGKKPRGYFVLQDHWSKVWYRNIRVKVL
jgi:hypothetical protein